jgi:hypothetical protein
VLLTAGAIRQQQIDAAMEVSHAKPKRYSAALVPLSAALAFSLDSFSLRISQLWPALRFRMNKNSCVI